MRPNFPLAFPLAIVAGAVTAFVVSILMIPVLGTASEKTYAGATTAASLIAWYAAVICTVYVLLIGIGVVVYVRNTRRVPSLRTAIIVGVLAAGIPFLAAPLIQRNPPSKFDLVMLPVLAITSAISAAWMFWRVALRGRTAAALLVIAVLSMLAAPLRANDLVGRDLVIPFAGRSPGAFGSVWRTDVSITNTGSKSANIGLGFHDEGGFMPAFTTLRPGQTLVIPDIVSVLFRREVSHGWLRISGADPNTALIASARVYNTAGSAGEFGSLVPAMPLTTLSQHAVLAALSGVYGNRTNAGITNPNELEDASVELKLINAVGEVRASSLVTVKRGSVLLLSDVFASMGVEPLYDAQLDVNSTLPVYAFASVIHPSGDSDLIMGAAPDHVVNGILAPACAAPAEIALALLPSFGYNVQFKASTTTARIAELEAKYGFRALFAYPDAAFGSFFTQRLTDEAVAGLRCESDLRLVQQNGHGSAVTP
jgi:hypothetical protein